MENEIVLLDSSVLIEYFRKKDKEKTILYTLADSYNNFAIPSIVEFEVFAGASGKQLNFWEEMLKSMIVFPFDSNAARTAVTIMRQLKTQRITTDKADLFIAATAVANSIPLATLNQKHFAPITGIRLV